MPLDFPIVDAHQHFWDPRANYYPWLCDAERRPLRYGDYSALCRPYLPNEYRADAATHHVIKTVHVEAEWDPRDPIGETKWVSGLARRHGLPSAMVAQAWLDRDDVADVLTAQATCPLVRGIRHKPRSAERPDAATRGAPGSMDDQRWRDGFALLSRHRLSFDLQTPWWHLDAAAELAADFPQTTIILNHTGLPADRSAEGLAAWRQTLATLAERPNAALKISGLGLKGRPWQLADNAAVIHDAIAIFGSERCMFASNYPVDSLRGSFDVIYTGFKASVAHLRKAAQRQLFHDNAIKFYRL
ncbi:MAG TPA: amidohydrolase family protein [Alphaproteobacteria bacterium]